MSNLVATTLTALLFVSCSAVSAETRRGSFQETTTVIEVAGEEWAASFASYTDPDQEVSWSVVVPDNYDPETPAGVLVYVSPSNSGRLPRGWKSVLAEQNLIWVSANKSGNRVDTRKRIAYSLLGPTFIAKEYKVDSRRIYVAGLSGGGRVASIVAPAYPTIFDGAIYICGVNAIPNQLADNIDALQSSRFVFVTGENDFNRAETSRIHDDYQQAGLENSYYLEFRRMGHENPDGDGLTRAIAFLDSAESVPGI